MGFIREPKGVDFLIAPSQTTKEDISFISNYIRQHKVQAKTNNKTAAQGFLHGSA